MAFALYGVTIICAPAIGPTLGVWITDNYFGRWISYINVPVGILALLLGSQLILDPGTRQLFRRWRPFSGSLAGNPGANSRTQRDRRHC